MRSLQWFQVNAWRLSQHCLAPRLAPANWFAAVERTGGIQAQVMSAAEMAIWARVDGLLPQQVQNALWQEHTLVKTWAMRATLHLLSARDLPLYVAARSVVESRNWQKYFTFFGISPAQAEAFIAAVPQILGSQPLTREQLAAAVGEHLGDPELGRHLLSSSWGSLWKPSAWRGDLCCGPNLGRNVTFVNPRQWLAKWTPIEPYFALQQIARRYLRAYGPATPRDFAMWWGMGITPARRLFQSIADELAPVEVEGWQALALQDTLEPIQQMELPGAVHLLPFFDAYVMGIGRGAEIEPILPKPYQRLVYRPQGWISAVVLADGRMKGIWEYENSGSQFAIKVHFFSTATPSLRKGIEVEAERLASFLNSKVVLGFEEG